MPLTIINAGRSGDNTQRGLERLERDVLSHQPDLAVVCFGLNDIVNGMVGLDLYLHNLESIFQKLQLSGIESIFMTPNVMNTYISQQVTEPGPA